MKLKRVLVAGGAGFIGSYLCETLLNKNFFVICIDDISSGVKKNVDHLLNDSNFKFIKRDIKKPINLKVNYIFNLASPASPVFYQKISIHTLMTNSIGTFNLLELARKNKARFLLASTSEVYGDPLRYPQKENYWGNVNPIGPRACYDESKRFAETLTINYHWKYGVDTRIARIFNTYGLKMRLDDGRVIPNFVIQCLTGKPITVYGNGSQTRSFCYVDDTIDGLMKLMFKKNIFGEVVNLGNPNEITILELVNTIKRITASESKVIFKPLPEDDPTRRCPDITKARKILDWEPKIDLETGLKRTIEWFKEQLR